MLIYKDVITGDEMISDSYDLKVTDNVIYEADCARITVGGDNIGTSNSHPQQLSRFDPQGLTSTSLDIGANPSAEEGGDEGADDNTTSVIDVVHSFRLNETSFDKKSYLGHLKQYMKKVKESMKERNASDEEIKEFETGAQTFAKKVVGSFKDWEFFTGESMDPDGMVVLLNYREDGTTPYACFWKHGMTEMKV
ncbi:hypothetical protein E4T39_05040 [Aureobasidium subglaciale]|nr:hypothetical protein E4T39_05040 [Aureobasidium subglaciale]